MKPLYRIPHRFIPTFEEGKEAARLQRLINPDERTKILDEVARQRAERDRRVKIETTRQIARESTALRAATKSARFREDASSPSPAALSFDATLAAKWQATRGKPEPHWWAKKAEREAHAIELLAAAGRLKRRKAA